jgi:hypothetical protein
MAPLIEVAADDNAPEIVFQVSLPQSGDIGVFEHGDAALEITLALLSHRELLA